MRKQKLLAIVMALMLILGTGVVMIPASADEWNGASLPSGDASYAYSGGSGTEADPYLVSIPYDLAMMAVNTNAKGTNANTAGKYFLMTQDIDMTGKAFTPIGGNSIVSSYLFFSGYFDGGGYTVSGLTFSVNSKWINAIGMFGTVATGCYINNLTVEGSVTVSGKAYNSVTYLYVGGIVGYAAGALTMENVTSNMDITVTETNTDITTIAIGGIIGTKTTAGDVTMTGCSYDGTIICNGNGNSVNMGGLIGDVLLGTNTPNISLESCKVTGSLTTDKSNDRIGGLLGEFSASTATLAFNKCHVDVVIGNARSDGYQAGAILGYIWSTLKVANVFSGSHNFGYAARTDGTEFYLCGRLNVSDVKLSGNASGATALNLPDYAVIGRIAATGLLSNLALQTGTAESDSGKFSIRFLTEFAGTLADYTEVGFLVTASYGGSSATVTLSDTVVFSTVSAGGNDVAPSNANAYFIAIGLKNIPASGTVVLTFTPFVVADGDTIPTYYGSSATATFTDGVI